MSTELLRADSVPAAAPTTPRRLSARPGLARAIARTVLYISATFLAVIMFFPFGWTLVVSLIPGANLAGPPEVSASALSVQSYIELFDRVPVWRYLTNSLIVSLATTVLQVFTGSTAAYAFARLRFRGRNALFAAYLATMLIPLQISVIPLFVEMRALGLDDTYFALIAPSAASALSVFILRQAMLTVPRELDEAALIDGASPMRIYAQVILPLIRPSLATVAILVFLGSWNSFLWPLIVIQSDSLRTLPLGLSSLQGVFSSDWSVILAGSVVSTVPVLALFIAAQRHFVAGVSSTGIK